MTRLLRAFTLAAALLGLLAIVACGDDEGEGPSPPAGGQGTPTAVGEATPAPQVTPAPTIPAAAPAIEMGIDPETTGNTASTLGTIEQCYEVTCPSEECSWDGSSSFDGTSDYVIDVYVDDPAGGAPAPVVYDAWVYYDQTKVHIAAPGTDGKIKMPGADFGSCTVPTSSSPFVCGWMFLLTTPVPGTNTYIGDGPLLRLGLDFDGTQSGVVTFTLDPAVSSYQSIGPGGWPNTQQHPLTFRTAQVAINTPCPAPPSPGHSWSQIGLPTGT